MSPFKTAIASCVFASLVVGCSDLTTEAYEANSDRFHAAATALRSTSRPPTLQQGTDILPVDLSQTYVGLSPSNLAYIQYRDGDISGVGFRIEDGEGDRCRHLVHRPRSSITELEDAYGLCGPIRRTKRLSDDWRVEISGRRLIPFF